MHYLAEKKKNQKKQKPIKALPSEGEVHIKKGLNNLQNVTPVYIDTSLTKDLCNE